MRRGRGARSMAVYAIVAYDLAGRKDVLGLWMQETEGAHHWIVYCQALADKIGVMISTLSAFRVPTSFSIPEIYQA